MKKLLTIVTTSVAALVVLVMLSSRHLSEVFGYAKATADTTVNQMEDHVPTAIRDMKLKNDIEQARSEIIDRRVKLNLASTEIRRMQEEIEQLAGSVSRRETILAEAYPALETAASDRLTEVSFAGTKWLPTELGVEIDKLLMEQDRDERQLDIRREALDRLLKSVEEGSAAIAQMESKLLEAENEFQALVVRRDQAENENELLDLVAAAGKRGNSAAAHIGTNLEDLRGDVEQLEARNEARRETVPVGEREQSRLTQAYDRLERLKALHEKRQSESSSAAAAESVQPNTERSESDTAAAATLTSAGESSTQKDVVIVIKDSQLETRDAQSSSEDE